MPNVLKASLPRKIPLAIAKLLGPPQLWRDESREQYDAMLLSIAESVGAKDIVDWIAVRDVTYHAWDHYRLQGIKSALILEKQIEVIEGLLKTTYDPGGPKEMTYNLSGAKNDARRRSFDGAFAKKIDQKLAARGHDAASILGRAYSLCAADLQMLDKAIADRELRRMTMLREIYRRDDFLARRLEKVSQQIIEGEFSEAAD